jgi:hypothetical protein
MMFNFEKGKIMKELNLQETQYVSGGCGPGMFDGLIEGMIALAGIGMVGSFLLGAAVVGAAVYWKS